MISSADVAREMANRSIRWIVVCCLVGRLLTTFTDVGPALLLNADPSGWAFRLATVVAVIDVLLLVGLSWGRLTWIVASWWFLVLDIAVAIGINVFVVSLMPPGTFWLEGHDPLGAYLAGTMAVWAAIRGPRVGVVLLTGYAGVVAVEALRNGAPFDGLGWLAFGELVVWALISLTIGMLVMLLARASARRTAVNVADETNKSAMVKLHGSVLQVLARVGSLSRGDKPPAVVLAEIRDLASKQATAAAAGSEGLALTGHEDLLAVVDRARRACPGVVVDMVAEPAFEIPYDVADVVADAVSEALTNIEKHAGVTRARIHLTRSASGTEIAISDDGVGITGDWVAGFGLRNGITTQMEAIGGTAVIDSKIGRGTTVGLSIPREPRSITRFTETAIDWFVVVPVLLRALVTIANLLAAPLALDHGLAAYEIVAVLIAAANFALLGVVAAKRDTGLLRNRVFFAVDLAVAAGLVLLTAVLLPTGTVAELTLLNTTVYIVPTVPLWGAVWGLRTGVALLAAAFGLEFAAAAVSGVRPSWAALLQIITHYAQVPAAFILARLVMRWSRRGLDSAFTEGRRRVLADMFAVAATAMTQLATAAAGPATTERLREVRGIALATADDLDHTLFALQRGLSDQLTTVARGYRRRGVDVILTVINPPEDLSENVIDAAIEVARVVLTAIADAGGETGVIFCTRRDEGFVLTARSYGESLTLDQDHLHEIMTNAGGKVSLTQPSSGGTNVEITWPSRRTRTPSRSLSWTTTRSPGTDSSPPSRRTPA